MATNATTAEERLAQLGIHLPEAPPPFGAYVPAVQTGNLLFLSGMLATSGHAATAVGIVGGDLDVKAGREAACTAALNALALTKTQLGSLNRVSRIVRLGVYVAATPQFADIEVGGSLAIVGQAIRSIDSEAARRAGIP